MKKIIQQGLILLLAGSLSCARAQGFGEIRGIIKNTELQPVPFATVKILQGNLLKGGSTTDMAGRYSYKPLEPGQYEVVVMDPGHETATIRKIKVMPNEATYVDVKLAINTLTAVEVVAKATDYTFSGVERNVYTMKSIDATELMQNASYNRGDIKGALSALSSEVLEDPSGGVHFRGGRSGAESYFVDGVRCLTATQLSGLAIENLTFFSGGVPAMYGDMLSGAVIVTTKSYFSGIRDKNIRLQAIWEAEQEKKAREQAKRDEENRQKEIEEEKRREQKKD